jgi:hypothetical protein
VADLLDRVPRVTLVGQMPGWRHDPVPCVAARLAQLPRYACPEAAPRLQVAKLDPYYFRVNAAIAAVAEAHAGASTIDPLARWCGAQECKSAVDGHFLYRDAGHLRRNLPADVTAQLAAALGLDQLLPAPAPPPTNLAAQ